MKEKYIIHILHRGMYLETFKTLIHNRIAILKNQNISHI